MMKTIHSFLTILFLTTPFCASAAIPMSYQGAELKLRVDLIQDSNDGRISIFNPQLESERQIFPLSNDSETNSETINAVCTLVAPGSKVLKFQPHSGQMAPHDVLALSNGFWVSAEKKLKLDPKQNFTSVIDSVECEK